MGLKLMLRAIGALVIGFFCYASAIAGMGGGAGAPDPYKMDFSAGEFVSQIIPSVGVISNDTSGKAPVARSTYLSAPSSTAVIITTGQSNIEPSAAGTYTTTQARSYNLNIYDGGVYPCANPVLGAYALITGGVNSVNCQIADGLITGATYSTVIVVPNAIGSTLCSDWVSGVLQRRIVATMNRLLGALLTPALTPGLDLWILSHSGETDNVALTPRAPLATCYRNMAAAWASAGSGAARFFIATESLSSGSVSATVTGAQADAVASGCTTCRAGANWDSLTGGTNRVGGTHLTQAGAVAAAALDVAVIQNCKSTVC